MDAIKAIFPKSRHFFQFSIKDRGKLPPLPKPLSCAPVILLPSFFSSKHENGLTKYVPEIKYGFVKLVVIFLLFIKKEFAAKQLVTFFKQQDGVFLF